MFSIPPPQFTVTPESPPKPRQPSARAEFDAVEIEKPGFIRASLCGIEESISGGFDDLPALEKPATETAPEVSAHFGWSSITILPSRGFHGQ